MRAFNGPALIPSTLEHPLIGELENGFEIERVSKFHFGNLQVRTMSNINRIRIDNYLEILKEDNWKAYDPFYFKTIFKFTN